MKIKYISFFEGTVLFSSLSLFGALLFYKIPTDIQLHAQYAQQIINGDLPLPPNFLYYLTIYTVALFNEEPSFLLLSSMVVLSLAVTAKFTITRIISIRYYRHLLNDNAAPETLINQACIMLIVVFSLPTDTFYLGQIPPNVWHNSTTIFVMPFALSLFWVSYNQLKQPTTTKAVLITLLCILNVLIKPSFFFVFCVSYPLMLIKTFGFNQLLWQNLLPVAIGLITTVIEYYIIYILSFNTLYTGDADVIIRPLSVWSHFSSNITLSLVFSLVFPLTYLCFYWNDVKKHMLLQYAVISYLISISIFALLSETGPREFHGNFIWQAIICSYILFFVTTVLFAEKLTTLGFRNWKNRTILGAFISHAIAGILYLIFILYTKSYY